MSTTSTPEFEAINLTVSTLLSRKPSDLSSPATLPPTFLPSHLTLVSPSAKAERNQPKEITNIVHAAQEAASSPAISCGSLLAGPASDSTEYGDVGLWLGEGSFQRGHVEDVLKALGLDAWLEGEVCTRKDICDGKQA